MSIPSDWKVIDTVKFPAQLEPPALTVPGVMYQHGTRKTRVTVSAHSEPAPHVQLVISVPATRIDDSVIRDVKRAFLPDDTMFTATMRHPSRPNMVQLFCYKTNELSEVAYDLPAEFVNRCATLKPTKDGWWRWGLASKLPGMRKIDRLLYASAREYASPDSAYACAVRTAQNELAGSLPVAYDDESVSRAIQFPFNDSDGKPDILYS